MDASTVTHREPWNKGKIVGQKTPFKVKDIRALRAPLQIEDRVRELALLISAVPEPSSVALLCAGGLWLSLNEKRRRK